MIGSGIGGLTAAWLLKQHNDVTVYERQARPGMGIFTVDYASNGHTTTIDIPARIFCEGYYPNLIAMLRMVGVDLQVTNYSAAYADHNGDMIFHYGSRHLLGRCWDYPKGVGWLRGQGRRIVADTLRFYRRGKRDLDSDATLSTITFGDYLDRYQYSDAFLRGVLLPTVSTICTCDYDSVLAYPADMMLTCLTCGVMQQGVMRATNGVDDIVQRLLEDTEQICGVGVDAVMRDDEGPMLVSDGQQRRFDHIVVAAQAQQAADMVGQQFGDYRDKLGCVPFEHSAMTVHTEQTLLPQSRVPLSPVSYHLPDNASRPEVTVNLSSAIPVYRLQKPVFQTWNPIREVREENHLARADFTRPVVTLDSRAAIRALREDTFNNNRGIWFCGAYMADRVPLLEAAVDSAVDVATRLGARIPWQFGDATTS